MRESDLYADVVGGLMREGCRVYKIADGSAGKKPFDVGGCTAEGAAIGVEVKAPSRAEASRLDWALFEPHQARWLRAFAQSGAVSVAAVYDRESHVMLAWRLRSAADICDRKPDAILSRSGGFFTGWTQLTVPREGDHGKD